MLRNIHGHQQQVWPVHTSSPPSMSFESPAGELSRSGPDITLLLYMCANCNTTVAGSTQTCPILTVLPTTPSRLSSLETAAQTPYRRTHSICSVTLVYATTTDCASPAMVCMPCRLTGLVEECNPTGENQCIPLPVRMLCTTQPGTQLCHTRTSQMRAAAQDTPHSKVPTYHTATHAPAHCVLRLQHCSHVAA